MTDDSEPTTEPADIDDVETTDLSASSTYKVLGEFADESGAGLLGRNTADSGTPIGVEGAVPNNSTGYGLSTPHDARVDGTASLDQCCHHRDDGDSDLTDENTDTTEDASTAASQEGDELTDVTTTVTSTTPTMYWASSPATARRSATTKWCEHGTV